MTWQPIDTAPENVTVRTKNDHWRGIRKERNLRRLGNIWWYPNLPNYVNQPPTHWAPLLEPSETAEETR